MVRATRSGCIASHATSKAGGRDYREQVRLRKRRKVYEQLHLKQKNDGAISNPNVSTRARTTEIEAMYADIPSASSLFNTSRSPSPTTSRRTRQVTPSCTDYGPMRHALYNKPIPHFFFCGQCDAFDNDKHIVANIKQTSRRYQCIADHASCIFPTTTLAPSQAVKPQPNSVPLQFQKREIGAPRCLAFDEPTSMELEGIEDDVVIPHLTYRSAETNPMITIEELQAIIALQRQENGIVRARNVELQAKNLDLQNTLISRSRTIRHLSNPSSSVPTVLPLCTTADEEGLPCSPAVKSGRKHRYSENGHFQEEVTAMLNKLVTAKGWGRTRVGKELAALVFEYDDAVCLEALITKSKHWLRKNVFTTYNILREMDRAGGTLGYEGIEIFRAVETKRVKWYKGSLIPSVGELKRTAAKVERLAHCVAPFVLGTTAAGDKESIDFVPYWKIMGTVFRAYGLIGVGSLLSILAVFSLDGASITKNLGHVLGGFKVVDRSSRDPISGELLLDNPTELNAQSRNLCFPLKLIMGKETKETLKEFGPMFNFMEACQSCDPRTNPMTKHYGLKPLTTAANCDLSAGWKCLCKGGAAKVANLPCHCCALYKLKWAIPNSDAKKIDCNLCHELHSGIPDWQCYHHSMMTPESLEQAEVELSRLTTGLSGNLDRIDKHSKLQLDDVENASPESTKQPTSIHYRPTTVEEQLMFGELLSEELILRDMSPLGIVSVKLDALRKAVLAEAKIRLLLTELSHGTPSEGAMFLLIQAIPCILHLENRIGIKILTMLVIEGLSNAKKGLLYTHITAEGPRVKLFFERIADIVNKQVLGTETNSTEWECATDEKKKEIGTITMDNVRTRAIMARLELLIEECIIKEQDKAKWLACIPKFRDGMLKLRSKDDFDGDAVSAFQKDIDEFFQLWVQLWGLEGCTNYIHMMSSGHLSTYLFKWKNLYRHSQQGWEAFNSLLKTFYFRRTQHGGSSNGGRGRKSRLLPIGRWLQRRVVWLCGYQEDFIESWIAENPGAPRSGEVGGPDGAEEEAEEHDIFTGIEGFI
jgi:hypothetical protein